MSSRQEPVDKGTEEIPEKCPNCGKKGTFVRDEESGELVCGNCGFVLREKEEETRRRWMEHARPRTPRQQV